MTSQVGTFTDLQPMLQVASGLQRVHDAGLTHRDIKPANLIAAVDGRAVLIDFGVVFDPERSRVTKLGTTIGTPGYMAPEILEGEDPSPRSDWFAWGVTLFQLCEGRLPFTREDFLKSVTTRELPLLEFRRIKPNRRPGHLLRRCLAFEPDERPGCLQDILDVLRIEGEVALRPRRPQPPVEVPRTSEAPVEEASGVDPGSYRPLAVPAVVAAGVLLLLVALALGAGS